jgi:GTP-binding protein
LKITAEFVTSAAGSSGLPADALSEIALVGRSNVGKSTLINALARRRLARTSGAPGKTRLANVYRLSRGGARPFYVVDLPGYGYARGGPEAARWFGDLTQEIFARAPLKELGALLLVDARHPGLASDRDAWGWLKETVARRAIVATKIDKLARGERIRALREFESVFDDAVLPVSAVTGEGLDELWNLIDTLAASSRNPQPRRSRRPPKATAPRLPKK